MADLTFWVLSRKAVLLAAKYYFCMKADASGYVHFTNNVRMALRFRSQEDAQQWANSLNEQAEYALPHWTPESVTIDGSEIVHV